MIYLAPIQGTTDRIYRNLFAAYFKGVDKAVAPFVSSSKKIKTKNALLRELNPEGHTGMPVIPQIMSSDPDDFVLLANRLHEMGHDTVNWNLGCPFPMVVKKGRGAGMLCYPDRITAFLEGAIPALKPKLSIKIRLGLTDPDDIFRLLDVFNAMPLDELIIHPRTGTQMYEGHVDLDRFGQYLRLSKHPVVYNGDINSVDTFSLLSHRFPHVNRWMLGRGLLGNPFLAEDIQAGTGRPYAERLEILKAFHDALFAEYARILQGPSHLINKMKEIWTYLGDFFENADAVKKSVWKTNHPDRLVVVVNTIFDEAA